MKVDRKKKRVGQLQFLRFFFFSSLSPIPPLWLPWRKNSECPGSIPCAQLAAGRDGILHPGSREGWRMEVAKKEKKWANGFFFLFFITFASTPPCGCHCKRIPIAQAAYRVPSWQRGTTGFFILAAARGGGGK